MTDLLLKIFLMQQQKTPIQINLEHVKSMNLQVKFIIQKWHMYNMKKQTQIFLTEKNMVGKMSPAIDSNKSDVFFYCSKLLYHLILAPCTFKTTKDCQYPLKFWLPLPLFWKYSSSPKRPDSSSFLFQYSGPLSVGKGLNLYCIN